MLDSASESENGSYSCIQQNESVGDSTILAEARNSQLQEDNASLVKELNILRAQFEQAVALSRKTPELRKENDELKNKIFEISSQRDDALHRLEIAIRAKNEATQQLESKAIKDSQQRQADVSAMQKEMSKCKKAFQSQLDKLYCENQKLQSRKDQDEVVQKTILGKVEKLITNSSRYFGRQIGTLDNLIELFEKEVFPQTNEPETEKANPIFENENSPAKAQELQTKYKNTKAQLKAANKKIEDLLAQLTKKDNEINGINRQNAQQVASFKEKLSLAAEEKQNLNTTYNRNIHKLEQKVLSLKMELQKAQTEKPQPVVVQSQPQQPKIIPQPVPVQIQQPQPQQRDVRVAGESVIVEQLNIRLKDLSTKLDNLNKENQELSKKLEQTQNDKEALIVAHEGEKSELNALKIVHVQTCSELETVRTALKHQPPKRCVKCKEIPKLQQQVSNLENLADHLKKSCYNAHLETEKLRQQLKDSENSIKQYKEDIIHLQEKNKDLQSNIMDLSSQISDHKEKTEEDFMPRQIWTQCSFEEPLMSQITKIARNDTLSAPSKLVNIYRQIDRYLSKFTHSMRERTDNAICESQKLQAFFNDFIVSLSIALNDEAVDFCQFLNSPEVSEKIIAKITSLRNQITDLIRSKESISSVFNELCSFYQVDPNDISNSAQKIMQNHDNEIERFKQVHDKMKNFKKSLRELDEKTKKEIADLKNSYSLLEEEKNDIDQKHKSLAENFTKMKAENAKLKESEVLLKEQLETVKEEKDEFIKSYENKIKIEAERIAREHKEEINSLQQQLVDSQNETEEKVEENNNLKKVIEVLRQTLKEHDEESAKKISELSKTIKDQDIRHEAEKQAMTNNYEAATKELTDQCEKHRADVVRLSKQIAELEQKERHAVDTAVQARKELCASKKTIKVLEEQHERSEKLHKAEILTIQGEFESKLNQDIVKQKEIHKSEMMKMMSFVLDTFRVFFDATGSINERSFKQTIKNVNSELQRLQTIDSCIRRLVGAQANQPTDDAVAQAMMSYSID